MRPSPAELWELSVTSAPPIRERVTALGPERVSEMRRGYVALFDRHTGAAGTRVPRSFLLVRGRRR